MTPLRDFFAAFDERAGEPARRREHDEGCGGTAAVFCLAAFVIALGSMISGGAVASPF